MANSHWSQPHFDEIVLKTVSTSKWNLDSDLKGRGPLKLTHGDGSEIVVTNSMDRTGTLRVDYETGEGVEPGRTSNDAYSNQYNIDFSDTRGDVENIMDVVKNIIEEHEKKNY